MPSRNQYISQEPLSSNFYSDQSRNPSRPAGPPMSGDSMADVDYAVVPTFRQPARAQHYDGGLQTMVCPTVTQTLYLRPKTSTRTIHIIRQTATQPAAESSNYIYATVNSPDQAEAATASPSNYNYGTSDDGTDKYAGAPLPPAPRVPACPKPTTEFRSFVYVSVQ